MPSKMCSETGTGQWNVQWHRPRKCWTQRHALVVLSFLIQQTGSADFPCVQPMDKSTTILLNGQEACVSTCQTLVIRTLQSLWTWPSFIAKCFSNFVWIPRCFSLPTKLRRLSKGSSEGSYRVLFFKNWHWIETVAEENKGSQLHGRRLRTWRWERPMYNHFRGQRWEEAAQDKQSWISQLDTMVQWWCNFR